MRVQNAGPVAWQASRVYARYAGVDLTVARTGSGSKRVFIWVASGHGSAVSGRARVMRVAMTQAERAAIRLWEARS